MWRQNQRSNVNPTDVLELETLIDAMMDCMTTIRRGRKSLRRTWDTTCSGLLTMERAFFLLSDLAGECSALLSLMETRVGEAGTEAETTPWSDSAISQQTLSENKGDRDDAGTPVGAAGPASAVRHCLTCGAPVDWEEEWSGDTAPL